MRLTVGPHPAAIYWRRRALVAAVLVLMVLLVVAMCGGPGEHGNQAQPRATPTTARAHPSGSAVISPTPGSSAGTSSGGSGSGGGSGGDGTDTGGGPGTTDLPTDAPPCADADMSLTTEVLPDPGPYGGTVSLTLIVRNTADHACTRDVGSAVQELRVVQGTVTVWSSDDCQTSRNTDVRTFGPNIESRFSLQWYTHKLAPHDCDVAATPAAAGVYQVVARLGTKLSTPQPFTIAK